MNPPLGERFQYCSENFQPTVIEIASLSSKNVSRETILGAALKLSQRKPATSTTADQKSPPQY